MRTCSNRTYDCRICMKQFSTGHGRALDEKKCRKTESTSSRSKKLLQENIILNTQEAIGRAFRVISLLVIPNPDYEAVLDDRRDQITDILQNCLGRKIKFYLGIKISIRKMIGDATSSCVFSSSHDILAHAANIDGIVRH